MNHSFQLTFGVRVRLPAKCRFPSLAGRRFSTTYSFDIVFMCEDEWTDVYARVFARPATLEIRSVEGHSRSVHGIVQGVEARGARTEGGRREYKLTLVPRLWLLSGYCSSRIFQDVTLREVVSAILEPYRIAMRWSSATQFPKRLYCLQYEESDLHFLERILGEAGVF